MNNIADIKNEKKSCHIFIDVSQCFMGKKCRIYQEKLSGVRDTRFDSLSEASSDIIVIIDSKDRIQYLNRAKNGHAIKEVIGRSVYNFVSKGYHSTIKLALRTVFATSITQQFETDLFNIDGSLYFFEIIASPIFCKKRVVAICLIAKNVTDLRRAQESLVRKNIALLEFASSYKEEAKRTEKKIYENLKFHLYPIISKLKKNTSNEHIALLEQMERTIKNSWVELGFNQEKAISDLSKREMQISRMIKRGMSMKDVGQCLCLSTRTIEKHRSNIRRKLGLLRSGICLSTFLRQTDI